MRRIHGDRTLLIELDAPADIRFRGEQQDLEEMIGNLVDNACKWAKATVRIEVSGGATTNGAEGVLVIRVEDDGPGLTAEEMSEAARRGKRLDETKPGSGLGLSIVTDLVALYDGAFAMARSPLGGLRAEVRLPAA
jgi:signal transduction histidine kinase